MHPTTFDIFPTFSLFYLSTFLQFAHLLHPNLQPGHTSRISKPHRQVLEIAPPGRHLNLPPGGHLKMVHGFN